MSDETTLIPKMTARTMRTRDWLLLVLCFAAPVLTGIAFAWRLASIAPEMGEDMLPLLLLLGTIFAACAAATRLVIALWPEKVWRSLELGIATLTFGTTVYAGAVSAGWMLGV